MLKTKHLFLIFIPAVLMVGFALFIRILQYEPLYPNINNQEQNNEQNNEPAIIPIFSDDPIIGEKKAMLTIIAFEDFGCAACKTNMSVMEQLLQKYPGKIKIIWKGLAVTKFPHPTQITHEYAYCANQQDKFKEFAHMAFANNDNLTLDVVKIITEQIDLNKEKLQKCLDSGLTKTYTEKTEQLALNLNIQAVPTIFVNNKQIPPPQIIEEWEIALNLPQTN